ncbi:MAG: dTDP-4-dehydrorhamnose reductase [Candidatus Bathyarchaeota archaeon]|nr:dTDP-4-dehydrorhamnose reductase [Candidatus Bathyarchaeota archaeon]
MIILVIGGGGQLGSKIIEYSREYHEIYATYLSRPPQLSASKIFLADKTDKSSIQSLVKKIKPDVVIDTAALHNVDYCETNKEQTHKVNVEGTKNVAEACNAIGAKMVFVSTDYVFNGKIGHYKETDIPTPINYYGQSKLDGENAIKKICKNYCIARTSVIYSWVSTQSTVTTSGKPLNFAMWANEKLGKGEQLNIVNDQYSSPTLADHLAQTLLKICEEDLRGIYHIAGKTRINRYDFILKIAEKIGYNPTLIKAVSSSSLKQKAKRPRDSSLNVEKIEKTLKIKMLFIDDALTIYRNQALEGNSK